VVCEGDRRERKGLPRKRKSVPPSRTREGRRAAHLAKRETAAQFDLDRAARGANVGNAFRVTAPERVRGAWVVLIDDVVTTGATLAGCAMAMLAAGAVGVSAVTVAREC
jgi:predicted amidophosphoribosyltransferase